MDPSYHVISYPFEYGPILHSGGRIGPWIKAIFDPAITPWSIRIKISNCGQFAKQNRDMHLSGPRAYKRTGSVRVFLGVPTDC